MSTMQTAFKTTVRAIKDVPNALAFGFTPMPIERDGIFERDRRFVVLAKGQDNAVTFDWSRTPDEPGLLRGDLEKDVRRRLELRQAWVDEVENLVTRVDEWVRELDWSTRRIDKEIEDQVVGDHEVPALLMQQGLSRVMLEPIGRLGDEAGGIADLYRLPAYDDIARLVFEDGRWQIFRDDPDHPANSFRVGIPLSKDSLAEILDKLRPHAS